MGSCIAPGVSEVAGHIRAIRVHQEVAEIIIRIRIIDKIIVKIIFFRFNLKKLSILFF